ncbi:MAG: amidohydrolase family protein [Anaerolineae bacterium]|nr:amidohydrolase family protein [Anaerolineae bacterium]
MFFFDCNVSFGRPSVPALSYAETAQTLLDEMDHNGIDEALVTCAAQHDESPLIGNPLLIEQIKGQPRLHPAWAILPAQTGEMPVDDLLAGMRENSVRALWAWPAEHHYLLDVMTFGPLLETLVARRIPLFVPLTEFGWSAIGALLADFPELTLVATDQSVWGEDRYFRPLIEKYPNLYLETSHYELAHGLRDFVNTYGAERWLFGSQYPTRYMGGALMQLLHTDIDTDAIAAIAGGNLKRLLTEVRL